MTERGPKNWKEISKLLGPMRTDVQCLHRWNKVLKPGLHKGPWKEEEDSIVRDTVMRHGVGKVKWSAIAALVRYQVVLPLTINLSFHLFIRSYIYMEFVANCYLM